MSEQAIAEYIKQATHELLNAPDWGKNTAISDELNRDPRLGRKVVDVLKKRLTHKNTNVGLLAISLLDFLVKNCPNFHQFVATKDFMKTMVKLAEGSGKGFFAKRRLSSQDTSLELELKERALVLIQTWGQTFQRSRSYPLFHETYIKLKTQGVHFPKPAKDELAPVFTPPASISNSAPKPSARRPVIPHKKFEQSPEIFTDATCRQAAENANLLRDMLTATTEEEDFKQNDLIQTLLRNTTTAQSRVLSRISSDPDPDALSELLTVNDNLLDVISYYDGLVKGTKGRIVDESSKPSEAEKDSKPKAIPKLAAPGSAPSSPQPQPAQPAQPAQDNVDDILDLFSTGMQVSPAPAPAPVAADTSDEPKKSKKEKKKKKKKKKERRSSDEEDEEADAPTTPAKATPVIPKTVFRSESIPKLNAPPGESRKERKRRIKKEAEASGKAPVSPTLSPAPKPAPEASNPFDILDFGADNSNNNADDGDDDDPFLALATRD